MVEDPLRSLRGQEEMLFRIFGSAATGKNADAVMGAAVNIIINCVRQNYPTRDGAEAKISELFGRATQLLLANHYDSVTGKRRNVFPHTQVVRMAYHIEDDFPQSSISRRPGGNGGGG
jgi:hypothetical protein